MTKAASVGLFLQIRDLLCVGDGVKKNKTLELCYLHPHVNDSIIEITIWSSAIKERRENV